MLLAFAVLYVSIGNKIEANSPKKKFSLNEMCVKFLPFLHWIFRF